MKNSYKKLAATGLAAALVAAAVVPAASAETPAAAATLASVVIEHDGKLVELSIGDYADLLDAGKVNPASVKYVALSNDEVYTIADYSDGLDASNSIDGAVNYLTSNEDKAVADLTISTGSIENGELVVTDETPSEKTELELATEALTEAIATAEALENEALTEAIEEAKAALAQEDATVESLEEAKAALATAVEEAKAAAEEAAKALEEAKAALEAVIAKAEALENEELTEAIEEAKAALAQEDATVESLEEAKAVLNAAILEAAPELALEEAKAALTKAIEEAEALENEALTEAIEEAKAALTKEDATVESLEEATEALAKAVADAKAAEDEAAKALAAAKDALTEAIEEAEALENEALTDAIAEAKAALEKEDATVESLEEATEALAAAVADATKPEVTVEVASVSAINNTSVEVTFGEDTEVTTETVEESITLVAGENTLTATYREGSLASGKAIYDLKAGEKLVDATTYTVAYGEGSVEFVAKIGTAYAKTFTAVTEKVVATNTTAPADALIYFDAVDQYGNVIKLNTTTIKNVKAAVTYNGLPLTSEASLKLDAATGQAYVQIGATTRVLVKGNPIEVTLTVYDKDVSTSTTGAKVVETSKASFTVEEGEAAVPTTLTAVNATYDNTSANDRTANAAVTEVLPGDVVNLTALVQDQYKNPVTDAGSGKKLVRWVVTEGKDLITGTLATTGSADTQNNTVQFTATKPGTLTVEAYNIANGSKQTYTIEIGASKLQTVLVSTESPATKYNNEEVTYAKIAPNPTGASLKPEDIKFHIVAKDKDTTASDVTVKAELRGGTDENTAKDIVIRATTSKVGLYEVTPYVGESFTAEGVIKGSKIDVQTTANPAVQTIEVDAITANELTAGTPLAKAITFKNKYGETLNVAPGDVTVNVSSNKLTVTELNKDEDAATTKVEKLGFTATEAGTYTATIISGTATKTIEITATKAAEIESFSLGKGSVSVIAGDSLDAVTPVETDDIFVDGGKTYKLVEVSAKDQYGNAFKLADDVYDFTEENANIEVIKLKDLKTKATGSDDVKYIGIHAAASATTANGLEIKLVKKEIPANGATPAIPAVDIKSANINVTVQAARTLKSLTVTPATGSLVVGASQVFVIAGLDQYERASALSAGVKVEAATDGEFDAGSVTYSAGKASVTVTGNKAGSFDLKVFKGVNATAAPTDITAIVPVTVKEADEAIKSITLNPTVTADVNTANYDGKYDTSAAKVYVDKNQASNKYTFAAVAKDDAGNEVGINQASDVLYTVVKNELVAAPASAGVQQTAIESSNLTFTGNVLTIDTSSVTTEISGKVTVKATSKTGDSSSEITLDFSSKASEAQAGTYFLSDYAEGVDGKNKEVKLTAIELNEENKDAKTTDGSRTVHLVAKDQYGKHVDVVENAATITITQGNTTYFTTSPTANGLIVTAKAAHATGASTALNVFVSNTVEANAAVTVDATAVAAIEKVNKTNLDAAKAKVDAATATITAGKYALTGTDVTWTLKNGGTAVANDNNAPAATLEAQTITLVASATVNGQTATKEFTVTVPADADLVAAKAKVDAATATITAGKYALTGTDVTWTLKDGGSAVANDTSAPAAATEDQEITLVATATVNGKTQTKEFTVTVPASI